MRAWFAASLLVLVAASPASADVESAVQRALESLQSGVFLADVDSAGRQVTVRPLRTWKSTSGHYCRDYELRTVEGTQRLTRCREEGRWIRLR